jgi:hypothetical protein
MAFLNLSILRPAGPAPFVLDHTCNDHTCNDSCPHCGCLTGLKKIYLYIYRERENDLLLADSSPCPLVPAGLNIILTNVADGRQRFLHVSTLGGREAGGEEENGPKGNTGRHSF